MGRPLSARSGVTQPRRLSPSRGLWQGAAPRWGLCHLPAGDSAPADTRTSRNAWQYITTRIRETRGCDLGQNSAPPSRPPLPPPPPRLPRSAHPAGTRQRLREVREGGRGGWEGGAELPTSAANDISGNISSPLPAAGGARERSRACGAGGQGGRERGTEGGQGGRKGACGTDGGVRCTGNDLGVQPLGRGHPPGGLRAAGVPRGAAPPPAEAPSVMPAPPLETLHPTGSAPHVYRCPPAKRTAAPK